MNSKFFSSKLLSGIFLLAFVSLIGFTSCSDDDPIPVTLGEYDTKTLEMVVGEQEDISIGGNGGYLASLDKEGVVTVSVDKEDRLLIKAVGAGTAKVTITDKENKTGSVTVKVINKLDVETQEITLAVGEEKKVAIQGNGEYKPTSSDDKIATATGVADGVVIKGIAVGPATITVVDKEGQEIELNVTVVNKMVIEVGEITIAVGEEKKVIIQGNGDYKPTSSDVAVATATGADDGIVVKGIAAGPATITVVDKGGQEAELKVTVKLNDLTVDKISVKLVKGKSDVVTILTGNGNYTLDETGLDKTVATAELVDNTIKITAVDFGETSLTLKDGAGSRIDIAIKVQDALVGTNWEDGTANPTVDTDYTPATEAILSNINKNPLLGLLGAAKLLFDKDGVFKMGIFANGKYRLTDDYIILYDVKGAIAKFLQGDVLIPIKGSLESMTEFDLPMNQTDTFDAKKMKEIADEFGDPKIADAKVNSVIININLKKKQ